MSPPEDRSAATAYCYCPLENRLTCQDENCPNRLVGSHEFDPLRPAALSDNARCRTCCLPKHAHPVEGWTPARPLRDRRRADFRWPIYGEAPRGLTYTCRSCGAVVSWEGELPPDCLRCASPLLSKGERHRVALEQIRDMLNPDYPEWRIANEALTE